VTHPSAGKSFTRVDQSIREHRQHPVWSGASVMTGRVHDTGRPDSRNHPASESDRCVHQRRAGLLRVIPVSGSVGPERMFSVEETFRAFGEKLSEAARAQPHRRTHQLAGNHLAHHSVENPLRAAPELWHRRSHRYSAIWRSTLHRVSPCWK